MVNELYTRIASRIPCIVDYILTTHEHTHTDNNNNFILVINTLNEISHI